MLKLILISLLVFVINIPFGYWRANVRKFSWQWILAIHIPVIIEIALRLFSDLGSAWYTFVFLVSAFFLGQFTGTRTFKRLRKVYANVSSCMVIDFVLYFRP